MTSISGFCPPPGEVALRLWLLSRQVSQHVLLCVRLAVKLLSLLVRGTHTWIFMLGKLLSFVTLLTPGLMGMLWYWVTDSKIIRNIQYETDQPTSRHYLDIYLPTDRQIARRGSANRQVVIFVSGGAWLIGYKLWSALVGRGLSHSGVVVVCPDYRNAPQADIVAMMDDIAKCIQWTIKNIDKYGGDPNNIVLAGQSAGAHICMSLLVDAYDTLLWKDDNSEQLHRAAEHRLTAEQLSHIKQFVGISVSCVNTLYGLSDMSSAGPV